MKKLTLLFAMAALFGQLTAQNPSKEPSINEGDILTLSDGRYDELHEYNDFERVGSAIIDMRTNKIARFIDRDSVIGEGMKELDMTTRFMTVDPMAEKYFQMSPYGYCANNPIKYIDPDGQNWFWYQAEGEKESSWHWQEGNEYTYKNLEGKETKITSEYEMLVKFEIAKTNDDGASVGKLSVYENSPDAVLEVENVFSGGEGFEPIQEGNRYMDLSQRDEPLNLVKSDYGWETASLQKGMQYFPEGVIKFNDKYWNVGNEWGEGRIRLSGSRNLYLHGKFFSKEWTHGCICDKSQKVFFYMWNSNYKGIVPFNTKKK